MNISILLNSLLSALAVSGVPAMLLNSACAGLIATALAILFTAPVRCLLPTFLCGFGARLIRDVSMSLGASQNWSMVVAAAALLFVAVAIIRRHKVSPVVLICAVLPLGAAVALFNLIFELPKLSSLKEQALGLTSLVLSATTGKALTGALTIALGLWAGLAIVRICRREDAQRV